MTNATNVAPAANAPAAGSNSGPTMKELYKKVGELAQKHGEGSRSLIAAYRLAAAAAQDGIISAAPVNGADDDAMKLYKHYAAQFAKKNSVDNPGSLKAQASKLRAFIKLGSLDSTKVDGVAVFDRAMRLRLDLAESDVKVKPETRALVDVATAQLNSADRPLTDHELREKIEAGERDDSEEAYIRRAVKALEKAFEKNQREETEDAIRNLTAVLAYMDAQAKAAELNEKLYRQRFAITSQAA